VYPDIIAEHGEHISLPSIYEEEDPYLQYLQKSIKRKNERTPRGKASRL
jgi:hypothetical protein